MAASCSGYDAALDRTQGSATLAMRNSRAGRCRPAPGIADVPDTCHQTSPADDRPVRAACELPARFGNRPLRFPLRLLHVRAHDVPAEEGPAVARGTRPAVLGVRRQGRAQTAHYRWRTAGAQEHHVAVPLVVAASGHWRARRTYADHQRQPTAEVRAGTGRLRRQTHQRLARHTRCRQVQGDHPLGRPSASDGRP